MKRSAITLVLICALSSLVTAGEVPTVGITSPTPEVITPTYSTSEPGEVPTVGFKDDVTGLAQSLIQLMISLIV